MSDPIVMARATSGPPKKPSPLAAVWTGMEALARRLLALEQRPVPKDGLPGAGIASALIDRDGNLILTRTDGAALNAGRVVGRDAEPVDQATIAADVSARMATELQALREQVVALRDEIARTNTTMADELAKAVATIPAPKDGEPGKSVTLDDVAPVIEAAVSRAVAALPPPKPGADGEPGKSVDPAEVERMVAECVTAAVAALPRPRDGQDADPAVIAEMVAAEVAKLPPAEPGRSITVEDVRPLIDDVVGKAVAAIPPAKDGTGIADMIVNAEGRLAVVLDDGRRIDAGPVVPEAVPGPAGRSVVGGVVNGSGHLVLTLSDDTTIDVGHVKGEPGESIRGEDGRGIASVAIADGRLLLRFTDDTVADLGNVKGEPGAPGKPGKPGASIKGDPGAPGTQLAFGESYLLSRDDLSRLRVVSMADETGAERRIVTLD
jgi:hypothetical protein